jgi:hypothetical protein
MSGESQYPRCAERYYTKRRCKYCGSAACGRCHGLPPDFLRRLDETDDLQGLRDLLTEALLNGVGLSIARDGDAHLDPRLRLSAVQRSRIRQVKAFGYRVRLLDRREHPVEEHA